MRLVRPCPLCPWHSRTGVAADAVPQPATVAPDQGGGGSLLATYVGHPVHPCLPTPPQVCWRTGSRLALRGPWVQGAELGHAIPRTDPGSGATLPVISSSPGQALQLPKGPTSVSSSTTTAAAHLESSLGPGVRDPVHRSEFGIPLWASASPLPRSTTPKTFIGSRNKKVRV
ncbi:hypothetical protein NDU88_006987 [Pleurodeles waltl]|uniref:Uncharacterized protein n=1 Tax=Pleurodeles waltl TaxID=8319 RepID=A0AAV7NRS1_PLEWA|nr:hypothetical protein NDU88_006987 [Pleurodeles waltl]